VCHAVHDMQQTYCSTMRAHAELLLQGYMPTAGLHAGLLAVQRCTAGMSASTQCKPKSKSLYCRPEHHAKSSHPSLTSLQKSHTTPTSRHKSHPSLTSHQNAHPSLTSRQKSHQCLTSRRKSHPSLTSHQNSHPTRTSDHNSHPSLTSRQNSHPSLTSRQNSPPSLTSRQNFTPKSYFVLQCMLAFQPASCRTVHARPLCTINQVLLVRMESGCRSTTLRTAMYLQAGFCRLLMQTHNNPPGHAA
jgi:hypothetical protein